VYDRCAFGKSSQPWDAYDYDTLTDDLKAIIEQLNLKEAALFGFSMGGGEVVRYFSRHGGKGISKAVLIASVTPFQLQTDSTQMGFLKKNTMGWRNKLKTTEFVFWMILEKSFLE
jgi:pimeloyl-ACP methyl ester carboxylesterase